MSLWRQLTFGLRSLINREAANRDAQDEVRHYLAQSAAAYEAQGLSPEEARRAARIELGSPTNVAEEIRAHGWENVVEHIVFDVRYAVRHFARTPLTTVTIVLTLTLGIGAVASMFSVMDGVFDRPAPGVPDDRSLVRIRGIRAEQAGPRLRAMSWPEVTEYAALTDHFAAVAAWTSRSVIADFGDGAVDEANIQFVSPNFFSTLGIRLAAGPGFVRTGFKDLAEPELTAVVSQSFAGRRFGSVANAVGKEVKLDGVAVRVVGVAPRPFNGPVPSYDAREVWLPLSSYPLVMSSNGQAFASRDSGMFMVLARLQPGVTSAGAAAAAKVVAARVDADFRSTGRPSVRSDVVPLRGTMDVMGIDGETLALSAIFGVMALLILAVCTTTVSSLLLGAAVARRQEIGVRLALGASRARIIRQLLTENAILAVNGGALGLLIFGWVVQLLATQLIHVDVAPDWTTAGFTVLFAMVTALICGISPALHATRNDVADVLKDGTLGATSRSRLQRTFVVAQIALTQPLLLGLAMAISVSLRGFGTAPGSAIDDRVVIASFEGDIRELQSATTADPIPEVMRRIASLPGVVRVLPQRTGSSGMTLQLAPVGSVPGRVLRVQSRAVPADYFRTLDVPIARGREFTAADLSPGAPGRIILGSNDATRLFGPVSPIGQRLHILSPAGQRVSELEVVGVVPSDQVGASGDDEEQLRVFVPYTTAKRIDALLIRTTGPAEPLLPAFREVVQAEAPNLPITRMETLEQADRAKQKEILRASGAAAAAGMVALFLASIGLYAVVAIAVGQRRREIGVRVAVGATPRQVVAMFFNSGLRLSLIGLLIGLPLSAAALRVLDAEFHIPWTNMPAIAVVTSAVVVAVASLATWLPARRAAGVDPLIALRAE
jgi:predicted permease